MTNKLAYNVVGEGKPVILLHGFLENKNMWNFLSYSDQNDCQYIMIDLPGHGNSPVYSDIHEMSFMAKKVHEIVEELQLGHAHFVGHSMGGYVALAYAQMFGTTMDSLGLFFSSPFADSPKKKEQRERAAELAQENREDFVRLGIKNLFNRHEWDNLQSQMQSASQMAMNTPIEGITAALLGMRDRDDTSAVCQSPEFPIFWIYGLYDTAVDAHKVDAFLDTEPRLKGYKLPIGHMGHFEAPDVCTSILNNFIANK